MALADDEGIVSFLIAQIIQGQSEILTLCTDINKRKNGMAKKILHEFVEFCRSANISEIFLEVCENNHPAIRLYEGVGFSQIAKRSGYYSCSDGKKLDAFVLKYHVQS